MPCPNRQNMHYGGHTTCVQIHLPGSDEILVLDSGTGIRNLGQQLMEDDAPLKGQLFITHPHWDHIQGFPFFGPLYHGSNRFDIHMPAQEAGGCRAILAGHLTKTFFPVSLDMMDAELHFINQPAERTSYDTFDIEYLEANHSIRTAMYKLHCAGHQLVFAPDNELPPERSGSPFMDSLTDFIAGADMLIHDAQYDRQLYAGREGWGHSAWQEVVDVARKAGVKKLLLTHHDPDADDEQLQQRDDVLNERYGADFELIQLAKEGQTITI